jgi:hypothetical protein
MAMTNGVSAVLGVILRDVMGLKKAIDTTSAGFSRMKVAAAGFAAVTVGVGMIKGLEHLDKAGQKYVHQLEMMKLKMSEVEQRESIFAANRVSSQVMTSNPTGNLEAIQDLRAALNSAGASPLDATREAIEFLPLVSKAKAVMNAAVESGHYKSSNVTNDVFDMIKALEEVKVTQDPKRTAEMIDGMVRASLGFGGKINARQWFQTLKYTRGAGQYYSDEFKEMYLPTLIQEMSVGRGGGSGGGPGNPLASLYQSFVRHPGKKEAQSFARYGMLGQDGHLRGGEVGISNPFFWVRDILMPQLHKLGIKAGSIEEAKAIGDMFGNRVAQQMIGLLSQTRKMEGDRKLIEGVQHLDPAYEALIRHDPKMVREARDSQWERLQTDLGKHITPMVTDAIYKFAEALKYMAEIVERHPARTEMVLKVLAGLAAFLTVAGTLAIGIAAITALGSAAAVGGIGATIAAIGVALAYILRMVDWRAFGAWASGLMQGAKNLASISGKWVTEIIHSLKTDILSLWAGVTEGLLAFKNKLAEWVHSLISTLTGAFGKIDWGKAGSNPWSPTAFHPPPPNSAAKVQNVQYVHVVNGRDIADGTIGHMANQASRPPSGTTRVDPRVSPMHAGMQFAT